MKRKLDRTECFFISSLNHSRRLSCPEGKSKPVQVMGTIQIIISLTFVLTEKEKSYGPIFQNEYFLPERA